MSKKNRTSCSHSLERRTFGSAAPAVLEALEPRLLLSLVAHLELNETSGTTAVDTVGNHDGTLNGDTTWDDARIDNGAYFDGTTDYIEVANSSDFNYGTADSFTISAWVRDDGAASYSAAVIRGGDNGLGMGFSGNGDGPGFFVGKYGTLDDAFLFSLSDGTNGAYGIAISAPADGYHLLTMVVDRSEDEMYGYVDGVLYATADISSVGSLADGTESMIISGNGNWRGIVDDVRVYDHALSTSDIEDLYQDAPTWLAIYADDAIAVEDEGSDDAATLRILRTGSVDGAITVNYSVSGTASSGDYSETFGGTVTIADGESYVNLTVTPVDDTADDGETLTITLASGTGYALTDIDDATAVIYDEAGLVGHWALDESSGSTASDSAYDSDGTLVGDTTWASGQINNGADMDGSGDYIVVNDGSSLDFGGSQSFTISAWVRDDGSSSGAGAVTKGSENVLYNSAANGPGWSMGKYGSVFAYAVTDGASVLRYIGYAQGASQGTGFRLMTMVVDRSADELYCYLDNSLAYTGDISGIGSMASYGESLYIGLGKNTWNGVIDDVRLYDYALDSTEISTLYAGSFPAVSIVAVDATAYESSGDTATFRVYRPGTSGDLTINYSVSGTVSSGDYSETLGGTVTITDGNSYVDITITPIDDATADNGETLTLTLAAGTGYQVGDLDEATVTIYDSDYLLAHLTFDETSGSTADDSASNHDGTLYGDATWIDGRLDNGVYLDGTGDTVQLDNSNDFDFGASTSFTVSAWVRDDGDGQYAMALSRGSTRAGYSTSQGAGWAIGHYQYEAGRFFFGITDGVTNVNYYAGEIYDPNVFHLVTMAVDRSTQEMYCYVDGALIGTKSIAALGSISSSDEALTIGDGYYTGGDWMGVVDDVRVYSAALSANEVAALYSNAPLWATIQATDSTAIEDDGDTAGFRISRTGTSGAMTVNYSVSGTASSGDYSEALSGTVTIADGESYVDIAITPVSDGSDNGETLTLTLTSGSGYTVGNLDDATVTIYDTGQLLARLTLDETSGSTADDAVGDHDGTRTGGTVWNDGRIDNGAYFGGSGDTINVSNSDDFNFGASQSFTVSAWVRNDGSSSWGSVVSYGGPSSSGLGYSTATQGPGWSFGQAGTVEGKYIFSISDGLNGTYSTPYTPTYAGGYHLLTMVVDRSTQEMYCYADGELFATKDISAVGSVSCPIGELLQISANGNWKGMIDDVRVYNHALNGTEVGTLYDDAPTWINVISEDAIATEDAIGINGGTYHILRTGTVSGAITVNYSVSGTASSADYSETLGGTFTMADGQRELDITITPVADAVSDDGETLTLTVTSGTGYVDSYLNSGTIAIYEEDGLLAHWELDETSGSTASDSTGNGFTASLVGNTSWTNGLIDNGVYLDGNGDYLKVADGTGLDFGGTQSFTVSAWVLNDGSSAHAGIVDKGNISAHYGSASDGAGWGMGLYAGSYSFGATDGITAVSAITGVFDVDGEYDLVTMVVDRGADTVRGYVNGELYILLDISDLGSLASFSETLYIGLSDNAWKGVIDDVRIYDCALSSTQIADLYADAPPVVAITEADATADETGSTPGVFVVSRTGPTDEALEVDYTVTGTAASADYSETLSGTVTIAAGESYAYITVTPVDDASNEGDETVIVTLLPSSGDYALLTTTTGALDVTSTVTIGDSDNVAAPQVTLEAIDSEGSEDGNDQATFRIYRSGATTSDLAVNYTVSGTAESADYSETLGGTVTIASGNSYADITITPITDDNFEYPEVLVLTLTDGDGYSLGVSDEDSAVIYDVPFSEQLNPTGDPIGGGESYSDIIDIGDADYVVDTAAEFVAALSSATYGDIIYVEDDAEIDLTGYIADTSYNGLFIPAGVTIASGRGNNGSPGGLLYTTDSWLTTNRVGMLVTNGDDIRITGLRIQGPSGYYLERMDQATDAIGIRCSSNLGRLYKNAEIDNCEIYNWTMAGVYVMYGEGVEVHHNYIHTNINDGCAYGIWFGASPALTAEWAAESNANLFDCNRHDIGSACHWPWAARYNIFGPNKYQQTLDRHVGTSLDTWVENNWIQADESLNAAGSPIEVRIAFNSDSGGTVYYNNNWTPKEDVGPGQDQFSDAVYAQLWPPYFTTVASGNMLEFDDYDDAYSPVASTEVTYLSTPYTVYFDSSESYDPEGSDIISHQWWFGDGSSMQGNVSYEDCPTHTYAEAGMYEVIHWAFNEYGVAGYETFTVTVRPVDEGYWLSAFVIDESRTGIPSGYYTKQVLIDDTVVWSDDVNGDEGWQHVLVDISNYVTAGEGARLSFRLVTDADPLGTSYYAQMAIDNVYIFGGDVADYGMTDGLWWMNSDDWGLDNDNGLIGRLATQGASIISFAKPGMGEIYQSVSILEALAPMSVDDFESGDTAGGENWDANWVLTGSAAVTSSGTPYDGTYHLVLTGSSAVASRAADLSVFGDDDVTLSFQYKADSFETGEEVSVEIYDGSSWQEVMVIEDGDDDGEYHLASIDLSGYSLTDDFEVRFTASLADAGDFFYVDDLMIA